MKTTSSKFEGFEDGDFFAEEAANQARALAIANVDAGQRVVFSRSVASHVSPGSMVLRVVRGEVVERFVKNGDLYLIINQDGGAVVEAFIGDVVEVVS
jgi:hypothetical protein